MSKCKLKISFILLLSILMFVFMMIMIFMQYQKEKTTGSLLPSIGSIYPEPDSNLPIKSFQHSTNSPSAPFIALEDSSICIEIWGEGLIEPGKYDSTHDEILERFHLLVNGREYSGQPTMYNAATPGRTIPDNPATGEIGYYIPPGFPIILCYFVPPTPGNYEVTLTYISTPDRSLENSWTFSLIDG